MNFKTTVICSIIVFTISCKNRKAIPDVSTIQLSLVTQRFEKDFYAIDTNSMAAAFDKLNRQYPSFFTDYLFNILGLATQPDTTIRQAKLFLNDSLYKKIFADAQKEFASLKTEEEELLLALKLAKHYFTKYQPPTKIITFIGPLDGVGTAITSNHSLAIGLQGYLGKDYPAYTLGYIQQTYPSYKTRRFERQYIATNCIKNIIEEMFPDKSNGRPLAERLIEEGKRMYLLDALLPNTADSIKTGYTQNQLSECNKNEKLIWGFFVQGNMLFEREPTIVTPYVTDGPKTQELSETAPGNIGLFVGWQIVKKWMEQNPTTTLEQLMNTNAMTIFNEAKYNP